MQDTWLGYRLAAYFITKARQASLPVLMMLPNILGDKVATIHMVCL